MVLPDPLPALRERGLGVRVRKEQLMPSFPWPRGYRSPAGELKPTSPALLKRYDVLYDSSLMGDDEPYPIPTSGHGGDVEGCPAFRRRAHRE
jgi:hypothetical protein